MRKSVVLMDDISEPSVMVKIPKFKLSEVMAGAADSVHPAFIRDGKEVDEIYISKYQNIIRKDRAYSQFDSDPEVFITIEEARKACEKKGPGWHLMTNSEWAAVALLSQNFGTLPNGNNDNGKDYKEDGGVGVDSDGAPCPEEGKPYRVFTGSGPASWSHDHTEDGIYDLNGNVWEYVDGLQSIDGAVVAQGFEHTFVYNIDKVEDGLSITTFKGLANNQPHLIHPERGCTEKELEVLKALALYPENVKSGEDEVWIHTKGTKNAVRGGYWVNKEGAGIFAFGLGLDPDEKYFDVGFRCAYCE